MKKLIAKLGIRVLEQLGLDWRVDVAVATRVDNDTLVVSSGLGAHEALSAEEVVVEFLSEPNFPMRQPEGQQ